MEIVVSPNAVIHLAAADKDGHLCSRAAAMSTAWKSTTKSKTTGLFDAEEGNCLNHQVKENKERKVARISQEDRVVS